MKRKSNETRWFALSTYLDKYQIQQVYKCYESRIVGLVFILHDRDVDENNKPVPVHYHIVVRTYSAHTSSAVLKWFNQFNFVDNKGDHVNTFIEPVVNRYSVIEYLTHCNHLDKYQYSEGDVQHLGLTSWYFSLKHGADDVYTMMLDLSNPSISLTEMCRIYGRDFVINYNKYVSFHAELMRVDESDFHEDVLKSI